MESSGTDTCMDVEECWSLLSKAILRRRLIAGWRLSAVLARAN